jgi:hypothetical protein
MKTIFSNNQTNQFDNFSFDILTAEELAFVKGGDAKEEDAYADPLP